MEALKASDGPWLLPFGGHLNAPDATFRPQDLWSSWTSVPFILHVWMCVRFSMETHSGTVWCPNVILSWKHTKWQRKLEQLVIPWMSFDPDVWQKQECVLKHKKGENTLWMTVFTRVGATDGHSTKTFVGFLFSVSTLNACLVILHVNDHLYCWWFFLACWKSSWSLWSLWGVHTQRFKGCLASTWRFCWRAPNEMG